MHLYIAVHCKTHNCEAAHILMYLGEKGQMPSRVDYWVSHPLMIECPICGEAYDYSDSEEAFFQKELPAPPKGYLNRLVVTLNAN